MQSTVKKTKPADAIAGIKHHTDEVLVQAIRLEPLERFMTPPEPLRLVCDIRNHDPSRTYVIKVYEVQDSVSLPKRKRK